MLSLTLALAAATLIFPTYAQESSATTDPARSADSPYWHDKYHGQLAMSTWNRAYRTQCPLFFTPEGVQHNFPGSNEHPFTLVGEWGPTPKYNITAFAAIIPEMNKIVLVVGDVFGFERFNATQIPFLGIGCDNNCTVNFSAYEAYEELRTATNNFEQVRQSLAATPHIWSSAGHGFGGMVQQIAALETNVNRINGRGFEASHSFGSPPVFNHAAAQLFNQRFQSSSSVRNVANGDSWPRFGLSNATEFVQTGMHMWNATDPIFQQSWTHCTGPEDAECHGGAEPSDHFFYYTQAGTCGETFDVQAYNYTRQNNFLQQLRAQDATQVGTPLPTAPITTTSAIPASSSSAPAGSATASAPATTAPQQGAASTMGRAGVAVVAPVVVLFGGLYLL